MHYSDVDLAVLSAVDEKIELAGSELLRMEDEGGTLLTKKQKAEIRSYAAIRKRIKSLLFTSSHRPPNLKMTEEN